MTTITLTDAQRRTIKDDMDGRVEMLSDREVEAIATKINKNIDIPFIKEGTEQTILVKMVKKIDRFLYRSLPNELYGLVKDTSDGISDEDAEKLVLVLGNRLNSNFDIPYIPEWIEQKIFELTVSIIVTAMSQHH